MKNQTIIIYDSSFQTLLYHEDIALYEEIWKEESKNLTNDLYKEDFLHLIKVGFLIPFDKVLIDHRQFYFTISPELQTWHLENIFSVTAQNIKGKVKVANIVTEDIYVQLSIEQTFDEFPDDSILQALYFSSKKAALDWLYDFES